MVTITNEAAQFLAAYIKLHGLENAATVRHQFSDLVDRDEEAMQMYNNFDWHPEMGAAEAKQELLDQLTRPTFPGTVSMLERIADVVRGPWYRSLGKEAILYVREVIFGHDERQDATARALQCASCSRPLVTGEVISLHNTMSEVQLFCTACRNPQVFACSDTRCRGKQKLRNEKWFRKPCDHVREVTEPVEAPPEEVGPWRGTRLERAPRPLIPTVFPEAR